MHVKWAGVAALLVGAIACGRGPSQSAVCKEYLACAKRVITGTHGVGFGESTYGTTGTCWAGTQVKADQCSAECTSGLASLQSAYPDGGCT